MTWKSPSARFAAAPSTTTTEPERHPGPGARLTAGRAPGPGLGPGHGLCPAHSLGPGLGPGLLSLLCLLLSLLGSQRLAAEILPYELTINPTGHEAMDQALLDASLLASLREEAQAGPFALVARANDDLPRLDMSCAASVTTTPTSTSASMASLWRPRTWWRGWKRGRP